MIDNALIARIIHSGVTLYMMLMLLRWLGGWLEVDLGMPRLRWVTRATDPPIKLLRQFVPPLGPWDWAPPLSVLLLWLCREVALTPFIVR